MVRGTTPTFTCTFPETVDFTEAANVYVTFHQKGGVTITKSGEDIDISAQQIDVYLSQEESLLFVKGTVLVQVNWTFVGGERACSNIATIDVGANLIPEVLA